MLGRDFEDEVWTRFLFELVIWPNRLLCKDELNPRVRCAFGNVLWRKGINWQMCWTKIQKDSEKGQREVWTTGNPPKVIYFTWPSIFRVSAKLSIQCSCKVSETFDFIYAISMNFIVMNIYCGWIQTDLMKPNIEAKLIWTSTTMPWIAADTNWRQRPRLYLLYLYFTAFVPIYCICTLERSYLLSRLRLKFRRRSSLRGTGIGWR